MMNEYVPAAGVKAGGKGYGRVEMLLKPILKYDRVLDMATKSVQALSISTQGATTTGTYISPNTAKDEDIQTPDRIESLREGKSFIFGDLNS